MPGQVSKLKIYAYSDARYSSRVGSYELQINPESFKHSHKNNYAKEKTTDTAGTTPKYVLPDPQTVSFNFHLDVTGVVDNKRDLTRLINEFKSVAYNFVGTIHSPNYLKLVWGDFYFKCRLTSLDIDYLLFNPSGSPLRAKLDVTFMQYQSPAELEALAKKSSPDLTHVRIVAPGDSLPLMCYRIYGDSRYYIQIAKFNRLNDFRNLQPGTRISFPPLEGK